MQTGSEELKRQQQILQVLGYYDGAIDGIWSDKTVAAKKQWERSGKFNPAIPNHGLPLARTGKLPRGISLDKNGLFTCFQLEEFFAAQKADFLKAQQSTPSSSSASTTTVEESDEDDNDATPTAATTVTSAKK